MKTKIDPTQFGLSKRVRLIQTAPGEVAILIDRKSRILMKDGERILVQAETIQKHLPGTQIALWTTAPVCSKTTKFLKDKGILVHSIDPSEL